MLVTFTLVGDCSFDERLMIMSMNVTIFGWHPVLSSIPGLVVLERELERSQSRLTLWVLSEKSAVARATLDALTSAVSFSKSGWGP